MVSNLVIGVDLALKVTAAASVQVSPEGRVLAILETREDVSTTSGRADPAALGLWGQRILQQLVPLPPMSGLPHIIGLDWSPNEAFWGSRLPAVSKAFLAGYLYRALLSQGNFPLCIPAPALRKQLGLQGNLAKEQVWEQSSRWMTEHARERFYSLSSPHQRDAVILALVAWLYWRETDGTASSP